MAVDDTEETQVDETSPETEETSQETTGYSQEQVDRLMEKVRSDSLAELGRVRKAADDAIKKATSEATSVYQQILRQRNEEELERAGDEPDKLATIRERQARRQKESELAEAQAKLGEANARLQELSTKEEETTREKSTREIAERLKVNPARLAELAKFTNGSVQAIEEIAKEMPKIAPKPQANLKPDSGDTAGGSVKTKYQIMQDFNSGKINNVQYSEQMKNIGEIP